MYFRLILISFSIFLLQNFSFFDKSPKRGSVISGKNKPQPQSEDCIQITEFLCCRMIWGHSTLPPQASVGELYSTIHTRRRKTKGGSHFAWERGWGDPNQITAQKLWYSIYYTPFPTSVQLCPRSEISFPLRGRWRKVAHFKLNSILLIVMPISLSPCSPWIKARTMNRYTSSIPSRQKEQRRSSDMFD
jgi:hypothetical protein